MEFILGRPEQEKKTASKLMVVLMWGQPIWSGDGCEYTPLLINTRNSF